MSPALALATKARPAAAYNDADAVEVTAALEAGSDSAAGSDRAAARSGQRHPLDLPIPGFAAEALAVVDPTGWTAATDLVNGDRIESLFAIPGRLWGANPHAAAVLAWKTYTYRLAQPLANAWATAREVPLLSADNVLVKLSKRKPYVTVGLCRSTSAVLPTSSAARSHDAIVIPDEAGLLEFLRNTLIEQHLRPLAARTRETRKIGERVLWGQVAAGIAYALAEVSDTAAADIDLLTGALGLDGLAGVGEDDRVWRSTCCLAFTTPSLSTCSDCCTVARTRERDGGAAAAEKAGTKVKATAKAEPVAVGAGAGAAAGIGD